MTDGEPDDMPCPDCGPDFCERDDAPDEEDCLNCGMCEWCVQRSVDAAEEIDDHPVCPDCGGEAGHRCRGVAGPADEWTDLGDPVG